MTLQGVTVVPATQTEALLVEDRDRAIARAEAAEQKLREVVADHVHQLVALDATIASERSLRAGAEQRCAALGRAIDRSEAELARARGVTERLEQEVIETTMVAESIITAPPVTTEDGDRSLRVAVIELLGIVSRVNRTGWLSRADAARVRELRRLVPS